MDDPPSAPFSYLHSASWHVHQLKSASISWGPFLCAPIRGSQCPSSPIQASQTDESHELAPKSSNPCVRAILPFYLEIEVSVSSPN